MDYSKAIENFKDRELISGKTMVVLEYLDEGYNGDYMETDPDDVPLLRFSIYEKKGKEWEQVERGSMCTGLPITITKKQQDQVLKHIMSKVKGKESIKRIVEDLSFMDEGWFDK